jgi:hypothetical protein
VALVPPRDESHPPIGHARLQNQPIGRGENGRLRITPPVQGSAVRRAEGCELSDRSVAKWLTYLQS